MAKISRKKAKPIRVKHPIIGNEDETRRRKKGSPPGRTLESVENQLVGLATDLARQQIQEGTASSQVITHFLKLGSSQAKLETEKLKRENELLKAKTEALKSQANVDKLYAEAIKAMRKYSGSNLSGDEEEIVSED